MKIRYIACIPFLLSTIAHADILELPENSSVNLHLSSQSYSDIVPIQQLIDDRWRQSPQSNAKQAFSQNTLKLSYQTNQYSVTLISRHDAEIMTTAPTSNFYYQSQHISDSRDISDATLDLHLTQQQSNGILLGYTWSNQQVAATLQLGYWQVNAQRDTQVQGNVSVINGMYAGELTMNEFYSSNNLLRRPQSDDFNQSGTGVSANLHLEWQATDNLNLRLAIDDIYSRFAITQHGYSEGVVNSNNIFVNDSGYQTFLPLYRGIETQKKHHFSRKESGALHLTYRQESGNIIAVARQHFNQKFYQAGYRWTLAQAELGVLLDLERLTPTLNYSTKRWNTSLSIDKLDLNQAMELNLKLNYRW